MVPETIPLPIPIAELKPEYTLKLGLYNVANGSRLSLTHPQTDDQSLDISLDEATLLFTPSK